MRETKDIFRHFPFEEYFLRKLLGHVLYQSEEVPQEMITKKWDLGGERNLQSDGMCMS